MRKLLVLLGIVVGLAAPAAAPGAVVSLTPTADLGLPFWCDWGYDWDERCYRDEGERLPIGGVDDKVWRSALRFSLASIPRGATISSASLRIFHDGTCVAPRLTSAPCEDRAYVLEALRILSSDWLREREPDLDGRVFARTWLESAAVGEYLAFDLTTLVRAWHRGMWPNNGVLLKLADGEEDFETSGPYVPSSSFPYASVRPALVIRYSPAPAS